MSLDMDAVVYIVGISLRQENAGYGNLIATSLEFTLYDTSLFIMISSILLQGLSTEYAHHHNGHHCPRSEDVIWCFLVSLSMIGDHIFAVLESIESGLADKATLSRSLISSSHALLPLKVSSTRRAASNFAMYTFHSDPLYIIHDTQPQPPFLLLEASTYQSVPSRLVTETTTSPNNSRFTLFSYASNSAQLERIRLSAAAERGLMMHSNGSGYLNEINESTGGMFDRALTKQRHRSSPLGCEWAFH